jgi:two-component system, cell cycle sensor histidine kinase PleC
MSHELRTPLNAIIGFSEMMQAELLGPLGNPRYADYAASIHDSGRHLLDLINDILDMSKIEAGKYELHFESVTLYKALRAACHIMAGAALDKQHHIVLPPEETVSQYIWVDARALTQILINLLSNAIKYTPHGGVISLAVSNHHNQEVAIKIIDNGVGIPPEFLPRIGNPFEQFDAQGLARNQQGSGLGLAITKRLVQMQQGYFHLDSQQNVGTTVTVRLPLDKRQSADNTHPYAAKSLVDFEAI